MRKIIALFMIATLICMTGCKGKYTHGIYELTISAKEVINCSVGSNWEVDYFCGNTNIKGREQWTIPLNTTKTVTIIAIIKENDESPDIGYNTFNVTMEDGFKTTSLVQIVEDRGIHKGKLAFWSVTCRVKLIEKVTIQ